MAATTAMPEQPEQQISSFGRIFGVLFSPGATFKDIARRPTWIVPVIVISVISLAVNTIVAKRVDWNAVAHQQIEQNKFAARAFENMPADKQEEAYQRQAKGAMYGQYVRGFVGTILLVVIAAALDLAAFNVMAGARLTYSMALAVVSFSTVPLAIKDLLGIPIVLFKDPAAINPANFVVSNIAALLPMSAPVWQQILGGLVDIFGIWAIILAAIGFTAMNPRKLTFGKSLSIIVGLQLLVALIFVGIALAFT